MPDLWSVVFHCLAVMLQLPRPGNKKKTLKKALGNIVMKDIKENGNIYEKLTHLIDKGTKLTQMTERNTGRGTLKNRKKTEAGHPMMWKLAQEYM